MNGEDLIQSLHNAPGHARLHLLQTSGEVAQHPFGFVGVVLVPSPTERLFDARMQVLGQALDDVAALVDLAALDRGSDAEGVADRTAECLRTIDNEQPRHGGVEPSAGQVVEQRLDNHRVLGGLALGMPEARGGSRSGVPRTPCSVVIPRHAAEGKGGRPDRSGTPVDPEPPRRYFRRVRSAAAFMIL